MTNTTLILADARPLLTLAIAGSLDALLLPGTRVIIPDMVMYVATDKPGSGEILDWLSMQQDSVCVAKIETYYEFEIIRRFKPGAKIGIREESATGEVAFEELEKGIDEIILLFDESYFEKLPNYLRPLPKNVRCMSVSMLTN